MLVFGRQRQPKASTSGGGVWQPVPTPQARRPRGEVVDGVNRRYPPVGAKECPLRHKNQRNGGLLRQRTRKNRVTEKFRDDAARDDAARDEAARDEAARDESAGN
ncbi:unnamed protein product [Boreogadus saida]